MGGVAVAEPPTTFAGLLRKLRTDAGLTQEELAEAAGLSSRSVSDLERGVNHTARRDTARMLADALNLTGPTRAEFEAMARGRARVGGRPSDAGGAVDTALGTAGIATATRTLPRDIASFTGREAELRELMEAAADSASISKVVGIHAIGGMAGIGKTAFAVHAAHRLAYRFPGAQIFLALHGHTPGQRPVDPTDALAHLLLTAGVPVQQIPSGLEERMALWRDRLADKQLLLVLDDAASSEQVRPLLPSGGGSIVLVTSRRHLSALEDARAISLDTLPPEEAAGLFIRLAARSGPSLDDMAVGTITRLCGYLPLAIGMLARQLHHHPAWSPADLAADLAAAGGRLELMQAEDRSVAAAFNLSYQDLTETQQRLFRLLGLHPGPDIDSYAAAALSDADLASARRDMQALYDQYLLTEPARGRYGLHDLIREHARALTAAEPPAETDAALNRLLDYYWHTAEIADRCLSRRTRSRPVSAIQAIAPTAVPNLPDCIRALSWVRAERSNLLACLDYAAITGRHARIVTLTAGLNSLLRHDGPWADATSRHLGAVQAARRVDDRPGEAGALHDLGIIRNLVGDYPGAASALEAALEICRDIGDRLGEANALEHLGVVRRRSGDFPGSTEILQAALGISAELGDLLGQANALTGLGIVRYQMGAYLPAAEDLQAALRISRDLGDLLGQANTLSYLGIVLQHRGDHQGAAEALEEALRISRDLGDPLGQANALTELGVVRRRGGDHAGAADVLEAALVIHRDLGNRVGQANALNYLGVVRRLTGDYPGGADALQAALRIYRSIGDLGGEVEALNEVATLDRERGDLVAAQATYRLALQLARDTASAWDEANALAGLARCELAAGPRSGAEAGLREALEIFERIGAVEAPEVSAELNALSQSWRR